MKADANLDVSELPPPPGPPGHPLWRNTVQFTSDQLEFCTRVHREYGDIVSFEVMFSPWVQLSHPTDIEDVLIQRAHLFHKPRVNKQIFRLFLGNGVLSADGEFWKRQHKLVQPGFHRKRIEAYGDVMVQYTDELVRTWQPGARIDFCGQMTELTLSIVAKTLFDSDVRGEDAGTVRRSMSVINQVLVDHINLPIDMPRWWPSRSNKRKLAAIGDIDAIIARIIAERKRSGEDHGDLLSMLVLARDDRGAAMTDTQLRDEAMTLFFAGHETTAHALTWIWYLLGEHPEVVSKLTEELDRVLAGEPASVARLPELPYLDAVVKEGMRLLPSVWVFMRAPIEDVAIGGYKVKKGTNIFISPYVIHRDPRWFEAPLEFRPERWTPELEKQLPRGAYIPFSLGPRICQGKLFALMEARLVLATLLQRVLPELEPGHVPKLNAKLSLSPVGGLPAIVRPRPRAARASEPVSATL